MTILSEFKDFAIKGNAVDMAVGIIIGASFGNIVSSFVQDIIMPPIGVLLGGVDFSDLAITIQQASQDIPAVAIKYGAFLQTVIDFLIVAFSIFMVVKAINSLKKPAEDSIKEEPAPTKEQLLLTEIRDLLKHK